MKHPECVLIWHLISCPGQCRRDQGTSDVDLNGMPDESADQSTTQPTYRLTTCFSVISSLTSEQCIHDEFAMTFKVLSK